MRAYGPPLVFAFLGVTFAVAQEGPFTSHPLAISGSHHRFHLQWAFAANGVYSTPGFFVLYQPPSSPLSYGLVVEFQEILGYMKYDYEPDVGLALQYTAPLTPGLRFVTSNHFIVLSTGFPRWQDGIKASALMGIQQTYGPTESFFTSLMAGLRVQTFTQSLEGTAAKIVLPQAAASVGYQF